MIAALDTSAPLELIWAAPLAVLTVTVSWVVGVGDHAAVGEHAVRADLDELDGGHHDAFSPAYAI